jgi:hypothetical protein
MTKLEQWQKNLKPGDPVRLLFNHMEIIGIFLQWKEYGHNQGAEFVSVGFWGTPEQVIEGCKNSRFDTYRERIISHAYDRIRPISYEILEDYEKECLTILKNKYNEYQNN